MVIAAGFVLGLIAGLTIAAGFVAAWFGFWYFCMRRPIIGLLTALLWALMVGGGPMVFWGALVTYVGTGWPPAFTSASGGGALAALLGAAVGGRTLSERFEGYWDEDRSQLPDVGGELKPRVHQLIQRFFPPPRRTAVDASVAGLERFLGQLRNEAQQGPDHVVSAVLILKGLDYEITTRVPVEVADMEGRIAYVLFHTYVYESVSETNESHVRRQVAEELFKYLTEEENVRPGASIPANILSRKGSPVYTP